jgi:hypothetical protein
MNQFTAAARTASTLTAVSFIRVRMPTRSSRATLEPVPLIALPTSSLGAATPSASRAVAETSMMVQTPSR